MRKVAFMFCSAASLVCTVVALIYGIRTLGVLIPAILAIIFGLLGSFIARR